MAIDPEKLLTTVATDLATLRARVQVLEEQDLGAAVKGIKTALADIREAVERMQGQDLPASSGPGTAPDWTTVDREEARELWDWLLKWCGKVLHPTYALNVWRPCWYRHQRLRVELTWLCAYWHWAYQPTAPPTRAAEWHQRWWPHVEQVMRRELARCGHASDIIEPKHTVPADQDQNDFEDGELMELVEQDIARRPAPEEK
ncbi:hypothetical protein [Streptomyces nanshensis]|uniref:DUF4913 domain-containing protein n=1 Tax=Streptomyces nanshensis TaxID=518642 RepID=A0A1E7L8C4_9ACTN|nr:hypothetical protein [Streptomyces nanshensis]OEV12475.1 hypothetical protein AN218_08165 [Streptomyces nanshensis]